MIKDLLADLPKPHMHLASFLLRLGLATIFIYHGILKVALDSGAGWHQSLPHETQLAVAWGETICGVVLLFGLLSRLAAVGLMVMQIGAIIRQTASAGFVYIGFERGHPSRTPTGAEYNFAIIVMCLTVLALGSGKVALDHLIFGRKLAAAQPPREAAPAPEPIAEAVAAGPPQSSR